MKCLHNSGTATFEIQNEIKLFIEQHMFEGVRDAHLRVSVRSVVRIDNLVADLFEVGGYVVALV